jgi:hypothetical protein
MTSELLTLLLIYYGLTSVVGGIAMAWRFEQLRRDQLAGAFSGFGAALLFFGIPGLITVWTMTAPKQLGLLEDTGVLEDRKRVV